MKAEMLRELNRIKAADKASRLRVPAVIDTAKDKSNALHSWFTWDAKIALQKNLENEARELISSYVEVVITPAGPIKERAYVSLSPDRLVGGGYRALLEVLNDADLTAIYLRDALNELESFTARYRHLQELAAVFKEIDDVRGKVKKRRRRRGGPDEDDMAA